MKTIIYLIAIFLLPASVSGQESRVIKGQVTTAETNTPIVDSHVYLSCHHAGTITDEKGNYKLEIPNSCMTQCLIVSHVGFERYVIPVHNIEKSPLNIELKFNAIELSGPVVTPDYIKVILNAEFYPFESKCPETINVDDNRIEARLNNKL